MLRLTKLFPFICVFALLGVAFVTVQALKAGELEEYPQNYTHLEGMPDYTLCREDLECVLVDPAPPCGCGDWAANKNFLDSYYDSIKAFDPDMICEPCPDAVAKESRRAICSGYQCIAVAEIVSWRRCEAASDCMLVPDWGRCSCGQKAVSKGGLSEFEAYKADYHVSDSYRAKVQCKRCSVEGLVYEPQCTRGECGVRILR